MFSLSLLRMMSLSPDKVATVSLDEQDDSGEYGSDDEGQYEGESEDGNNSEGDFQLAPNQALVTLSYSLMNQIRSTARMEGVNVGDIIIELLSEGVTRRAFEDASRPTPSHLMTRTGYVPPDVNGNVAQPSMSHHSYNNNNQQPRRGQQNNNNQRRNNNQGGGNNGYRNNNQGGNGGGFNRYGKKGGQQNNNRGYNNQGGGQQQGYRDQGQGPAQNASGNQPAPVEGFGNNKDEKK